MKKEITIDQLADGLIYLSCNPEKLNKELLKMSFKDIEGDPSVTELMFVGMFILTKLINIVMEEEMSKKILDRFHEKVFSIMEKNYGQDKTDAFSEVLNDRYAEYYEITGTLLKTNNQDNDDIVLELGTAIACNLLGVDKNDFKERVFDIRIITACYIYFHSHYVGEADMLVEYRDNYLIVD